jgi:hypothetical protein
MWGEWDIYIYMRFLREWNLALSFLFIFLIEGQVAKRKK